MTKSKCLARCRGTSSVFNTINTIRIYLNRQFTFARSLRRLPLQRFLLVLFCKPSPTLCAVSPHICSTFGCAYLINALQVKYYTAVHISLQIETEKRCTSQLAYRAQYRYGTPSTRCLYLVYCYLYNTSLQSSSRRPSWTLTYPALIRSAIGGPLAI